MSKVESWYELIPLPTVFVQAKVGDEGYAKHEVFNLRKLSLLMEK